MQSICVIAFLLTTQLVFGQISIQTLLNNQVKEVVQIDTSKVKSHVTWIGFDYGNSKIQQTKAVEYLKTREITRVVYTYSDYREVRTFKQRKLDSLRYEHLFEKLPELPSSQNIEWQTIRQTLNTSKTDAKKLFHGFIIYSTSEDDNHPLAHLHPEEKPLENTESYPGEEIRMVKEWLGDHCEPEVVVLEEIPYETGKFLPISKRKRELGIVYDKKGIWKKREKEIKYSPVMDTTECVYDYSDRMIGDSVVFSTLRRKAWTNAVVVQDVTGSMNSYLAQTFMWYRIYGAQSGLKRYVFFNDGDDHPDGLIGGSGGMQSIETINSEELENFAYQVMELGKGGKEPENDIEALYYAMRVYPDANQFILIADNTSSVRDMELLKKLKKPVHIIICGAPISQNVHPHYIKIAVETKGSIHTLHTDLDAIYRIVPGKQIKIGQQIYERTKTGFTLVR